MVKKMNMQANRRKGNLFNAIDKLIPLPEDKKHLVEGGSIHFLLNSKVMKRASEFTNELIRSRSLPVDVNTVVAADPIVVHILETTDIDELKALEEGQHYYKEEKERCSTDALIIALTYTNNINLEPKPYKEGEVAFDEKNIDEDGDLVPDWLVQADLIKLPPPFKNLDNIYERRLKTVYDLLNECGPAFSGQFYSVFNRELAEAIRSLIDERDEDGFQSSRAGRKTHARTGSTNADEGKTSK